MLLNKSFLCLNEIVFMMVSSAYFLKLYKKTSMGLTHIVESGPTSFNHKCYVGETRRNMTTGIAELIQSMKN